jgi:membrane protease YdiL (CAAX protease family)
LEEVAERRLPGDLAGFVIGGMAAASVAGFGLSWLLAEGLDIDSIGVVGLVAGVLYGILLWVTRQVQIRTGGGSAADTFGFRFERKDVGYGFLVFLMATVLSTLVVAVFIESERLRGENTELIRHFRDDIPAYVVVVLLAVVAAPLVEELFFRGVLLPVLTDRLGAARALLAQAVLFGLVHVDPYAGTHNVSVVVAVAAMGWVLGWSAHHYGRLGPGIVAHAMRNALTVVILFFTS